MRQKPILFAIASLFTGLLAHRIWSYTTAKYEHKPSMHTNEIISLGDDQYHVEIIFTKDGFLKVYVLDRSGTRPIEIDHRRLSAYVTPDERSFSDLVELWPEPQVGDTPGKASCFVGRLLDNGQPRTVTVPNLIIEKERFHVTYTRFSGKVPLLPTEIESKSLYATAGGKYTDADIAANGHSTPSQKYASFVAQHDFTPQSGDALCPITHTKANPACTWIVAGNTYQFCCPPCIDEFVRLAKEDPQMVRLPGNYIMP